MTLSGNSVSDDVASLVEERAMLIDWVLERLDDLRQALAEIEDGIDPPHQPPESTELREVLRKAVYDVVVEMKRLTAEGLK